MGEPPAFAMQVQDGARQKMKEITVSSVRELQAVLMDAGPEILYRGQTKHYGAVGSPSVTTSFHRQGCTPSEMVKWSYYASDVLEGRLGAGTKRLEFWQAILQHYGFRSFFLDVSAEPTVASWFASHIFKIGSRLELCEDCEERPVFLRKKYASYKFEAGTWHLYLIDKAALAAEHVGVVDLSAIHLEGYRPRFSAQAAWLLGPLMNVPLPEACYIIQINADRSIFRSLAAERSLESVEALFPTRSEDPVLNSLLSLPWNEISVAREKGDKIGVPPFFRRTIEFPEYYDSFQKILPPNIALFRNGTIAGSVEVDGAPAENIVIPTPVIAVFGTADPPALCFPLVAELVRKHGCVSFEIDQLIRHSGFEGTSLYGKGLSVARRESDLVEVGELVVEHPGLRITRAGLNVGWYYHVEVNGVWTRRRHAGECPCGNDNPHQRHLSALTIIEDWLVHRKINV